MCRLLGVVAGRTATLAELVGHDLGPFLGLAREHGDGWGIAWAEADGRIAAGKEPQPADGSPLLASLLAGTRTDAALLHLRLASPGLGPSAVNTHPFGDHRSAFAHNGHFSPAGSLDETLGPELLAEVRGETDSERFHLAVRARLGEGADAPEAIASAAEEIRQRADRVTALNCLLLTPDALYAYADHDPGSEVIGRRGPDFFDLAYRTGPDEVVVASTGWSRPAERWTGLPERHVLEVRRHDLRTIVHAPGVRAR